MIKSVGFIGVPREFNKNISVLVPWFIYLFFLQMRVTYYMFIVSEHTLITALKSLSVLFGQFIEGLNEKKNPKQTAQ